jgi:hypothetical protein
MLADSGVINSQSPQPQSVSGDGFYTLPEGYATRGVAVYGSVTGKQVSYRVYPPLPFRMWAQLQETLQG